jgi:hypothetical protein
MTLFLPIYRNFPEMVDAPGNFLVKLTMFSGGKKEVHIFFYESNDILVTLSSRSNQKLCLQDLLQNTRQL